MTQLMGIINVTPDSFYDGGKYITPESALEQARNLIEQGVTILDIGAESTKPNATPIDEKEELKRLAPVLEALSELPVKKSIDTYKPRVAKYALDHGCSIVNDISGLVDVEMQELVAKKYSTAVLMYPRSEKNKHPHAIRDYFISRINKLNKNIDVILDPGLGFGMTKEENTAVINNLDIFKPLHKPLLLGPSHKSFTNRVGHFLDYKHKGNYLDAIITSYHFGVDYLRVHDVVEVKKAVLESDLHLLSIPIGYK